MKIKDLPVVPLAMDTKIPIQGGATRMGTLVENSVGMTLFKIGQFPNVKNNMLSGTQYRAIAYDSAQDNWGILEIDETQEYLRHYRRMAYYVPTEQYPTAFCHEGEEVPQTFLDNLVSQEVFCIADIRSVRVCYEFQGKPYPFVTIPEQYDLSMDFRRFGICESFLMRLHHISAMRGGIFNITYLSQYISMMENETLRYIAENGLPYGLSFSTYLPYKIAEFRHECRDARVSGMHVRMSNNGYDDSTMQFYQSRELLEMVESLVEHAANAGNYLGIEFQNYYNGGGRAADAIKDYFTELKRIVNALPLHS